MASDSSRCRNRIGEPEIEMLPIQRDAELRFGDHALVKVVEVFPNSYRYVRWKGYETIFNLYKIPHPA